MRPKYLERRKRREEGKMNSRVTTLGRLGRKAKPPRDTQFRERLYYYYYVTNSEFFLFFIFSNSEF